LSGYKDAAPPELKVSLRDILPDQKPNAANAKTKMANAMQ
jgi:hypothetical protein